MKDYLQTKKERRINTIIENELFGELQELSRIRKASYSEIMRYALKQYLNKELSKNRE